MGLPSLEEDSLMALANCTQLAGWVGRQTGRPSNHLNGNGNVIMPGRHRHQKLYFFVRALESSIAVRIVKSISLNPNYDDM